MKKEKNDIIANLQGFLIGKKVDISVQDITAVNNVLEGLKDKEDKKYNKTNNINNIKL